MKIIDKIKTKIRGSIYVSHLIKDGCRIGKNFHAQQGTIIDPGHCWLIDIGDNVTLAPNVHILAHDASTKKFLGYTKIARVFIGNNVFIGAGTIILPGVHIGDNVVIGAGSIVTHDISSNSMAIGSPAKKICTLEEYVAKERKCMESAPVYSEEWIIGRITNGQKEEMRKQLENRKGYII